MLTQVNGSGLNLESAEALEAMKGIRALLKFIGEDVDREGLKDTPRRVVKAFGELCKGLQDPSPEKVLGRVFKEDIDYDEIVLVRNIEFTSLCEHHLLLFTGHCSVAYIPNHDVGVVGLSKIPRLVDAYAARPQVQERLGVQIANAMEEVLQPLGVAVRIASTHSCMSCRGVKKQNADMVTQVLRGAFKDRIETRNELDSLLKIQ